MSQTERQLIKGYELRAQLGQGGFGAVYQAHQPAILRDVAIKVILPEYANRADFVLRFEREAQIVARLEHPHIVPLYDYWRDPDGAYLVMRLMNGGSLTDLLRAGQPDLVDVLRWLTEIADALDLAHRRGTVHRDLKPSNILLDEDRHAYLADFGIALDTLRDKPNKDSVVTGSPNYMPPEVILSGPVDSRSDIYSMGILLYELLDGRPPFDGTSLTETLRSQIAEPVPNICDKHPELPPAVHSVIQRATAKPVEDRYQTARELARDFSKAISGPTATSSPKLLKLQVEPNFNALLQHDGSFINPYKGLRAFEENDAADFFGRDALTQHLLEQLDQALTDLRFLAVIGPSGSGKSSAVRAGLVPALRKGRLAGSSRWLIADLMPGAAPLVQIEEALLSVATDALPSLSEALRASTSGLSQAIDQIVPVQNERLVLVIDQFEELFTLVTNEAERRHVLESLVEAVSAPHGKCAVVITLRADYYDRPLMYPRFGEIMRQHTEVVLPLSVAELREAILQPALLANLQLESGLTDAILEEVIEQPGALPLLQYALTELAERHEGTMLRLDAYRSLGGVTGALSRRAEEVYQKLTPDGQKSARQLFMRLVSLSEGSSQGPGDTRHRAKRSQLHFPGTDDKLMDEVIAAFTRYRLLTADHDPLDRTPTLDVAHEALIRTWDRLRDWLNESRDDLRQQQRLSAAAQEWNATGRDPSYLASGARLTQFEEWARSTRVTLNQEEQDYLRMSTAARQEREAAEQTRQAKELALARQAADSQRAAAQRLGALVVGMGVFLLVAVGLALAALNSRALALNESARSATQEQLANENATRAVGLRYAAEANNALNEGSVELAALLAVQSLKTTYSTEGDLALQNALTRDYARQLFAGHTADIRAVAFTPDGKRMVTAGLDKTIRFWDIQSGQQTRILTGHSDVIYTVAFSLDGSQLVSAGEAGIVHIWDVPSGKEIRQIAGPKGTIEKLAYAPDGKTILGGGKDAIVRLWDVETGQVIKEFKGHVGTVRSVAFAPDGRTILTSGKDRTIRLWSVESGESLHVFEGHTESVTTTAFAPDGKTFVSGSTDRTARLWDVQSGNELRQFLGHTDEILSVAFAPDGKTILTGSADATARLWDASTGQVMRAFAGHTGTIYSVAFTPDGRQAATGSRDSTIRLWDVKVNPEPGLYVGHTGSLYAVRYSPDAKTVLSSSSDKTIRLWDRVTSKEIRQYLGHTDNVTDVAFSHDGHRFASTSADGTARVWDVETGQTLVTFKGHTGGTVQAVEFSPDDRTIVTGGNDDIIRLWDSQTGQEIRQFKGHTGDVRAVLFSPDGRTILSGARDTQVILWDVATGQPIRQFKGHTDIVQDVDFSPDGKTILTGSFDQTVRLWDVQTGAELHRFIGHSDVIRAVRFSPDGKTILTGSSDRTARVWDIQRGVEIRRYAGYDSGIAALAYAPDGHQLLIGSLSGIIQETDLDVASLQKRACERLLRDFTDSERFRFDIDVQNPSCPKFAEPKPTPAK